MNRVIAWALVLQGTLSPIAFAQTPQYPGIYLLNLAKSVADSGRIDDLATVADLLNVSFRQSNRVPDNHACPAGGYGGETDYAVTKNSWFHTLPTGKRNVIFPPITGPLGEPHPVNLSDPTVNYSIQSNRFEARACVGPGYGFIDANVDIESIPSYQCIGEEEVRSVFPGIFLTHYGPDGGYGDLFEYTSNGKFTDPDGAIVFQMTPGPYPGDPQRIECLLYMTISGEYPYGELHKPPSNN